MDRCRPGLPSGHHEGHGGLPTGHLHRLVDILAPDVVALGDGGGIKQAMPRPVVGVDKVSAFSLLAWSLLPGGPWFRCSHRG